MPPPIPTTPADPKRAAALADVMAYLAVLDRPSAPTPPARFARCRRAIAAAVAAADGPLLRKHLVRRLRAGPERHSPSVVAKALAQMTRGGELVNARDGTGYHLPPAAAAAELRRVACLAEQLSHAALKAVWVMPCDNVDLADTLEQLARASAAVARRIG